MVIFTITDNLKTDTEILTDIIIIPLTIIDNTGMKKDIKGDKRQRKKKERG